MLATRSGEPLQWEKPPLVSATYKTQRWRKYLDNLTTEQHGMHRIWSTNYEDWIAKHIDPKIRAVP